MGNDDKVLIDIPNWDKYQRALRGKPGAASRRSWVAVSVDLNSDPDFIRMPVQLRWCWVSLLLHAGKVGVPFELSPSSARILFNLRQSPDFQVLANQGLIKIGAHTDKTDKTDKTDTKKGPPKSAGPRPSKRCPPDWKPTPELIEQMKQECPNVDQRAEFRAFRDCEFPKAKKDWNATYRNWMRREQKRAQPRPQQTHVLRPVRTDRPDVGKPGAGLPRDKALEKFG